MKNNVGVTLAVTQRIKTQNAMGYYIWDIV